MQNSNKNFLEQANELMDKIKLHYSGISCKFDDKVYIKVVLKKSEIYYNYQSLVRTIVKMHLVDIEQIALFHDDKCDMEYLNNIIGELSALIFKFPSHKVFTTAEDTLHKNLRSIGQDLREYYMKLVWFYLPLEVKQKWMRVAIRREYGNHISNTKYDELMAYLSHKYM